MSDPATMKKLGELLIEDGRLTRENLDEALQHQKKEGGLIGKILIRLGYVTEEDVVAAIGRQFRIPYLPLSNYSLNADAVQVLPEDFCRQNIVIAFDMDEKRIFIALADPLNDGLMTELYKKLTQKPQIFISTPTEITNMLDFGFGSASKKVLKKAA